LLKTPLSLLTILMFPLACEASIQLTQPRWQTIFITGYGITNANQTQTVHSANTPSPSLDNRYIGSNTLYGAALFGLAFEKEFETSFKNTSSTLGLEIDYMRNNSVNGTVEPMVNVSPNFDVLKYFYDIHTLAIQMTGKYIKQKLIYNAGVYIQAGLGGAINRLSNYHEYAPDYSATAPMLLPYGNKNTSNLALSAGAGVIIPVGNHPTNTSIGYRIFYTGRGRLMKSPIQQTNASLVLSPITYQFITVSLEF
jgi:hypothetical protein